jgi:hypothetical protein
MNKNRIIKDRPNATYETLLYTIEDEPLSKQQQKQIAYIVLFLFSLAVIAGILGMLL